MGSTQGFNLKLLNSEPLYFYSAILRKLLITSDLLAKESSISSAQSKESTLSSVSLIFHL